MTRPTSKEIHSALLDAFRDEDSLARMVTHELEENINAIAGGDNLSARIFKLIEWAESHGRTVDLIKGALIANAGNPELQKLINAAPALALDIAPTNPTPSPNPSTPIQLVEPPYGTMNPESPLYVERTADEQCLQIINGGNPFTIYGQAPRQMGKSSLMQRILNRAQRDNDSLNVAFVDFEKFAATQLADIDQFLIGLCLMIGRELNVPEKIDEYWASKYQSPLIKCSDYIFDYLLAAVDGPVIIAMDEVEKVLGLPFQDDFFGMVRTWHNDRARDPNIARVSLFLSSSTEPELFIENPNQSPFNVAQPVTLSNFSQAEVTHLNTLHGGPLPTNLVPKLHTYLNGHPYLTRQALYTLATTETSFEQLIAHATTDDSPFKMHLQNLWRHVGEMPDLRDSLNQILHNEKHPSDRRYYRLKGAGLIARDGEKVYMANQLYAEYFGQRLL